jgi:hypothetical protein
LYLGVKAYKRHWSDYESAALTAELRAPRI